MPTSTIPSQRLRLQDIRLVWDTIKPAIEALKVQWQFDWRAEDIYAQCLMGRAFCYTCEEGFMIVKPQENQFTLAKELFVWLCYSRATDGLSDYYPDICGLARDLFASTIVFNSPRDGFIRVAKANKWPAMTEYRIPVI
jgi:hypothetical protein